MTAQGYARKRSFNARLGVVTEIPGNVLSNPVTSSHITGFARALLSELMIQVERRGGVILSCTTDGFFTSDGDLLDRIDRTSPLVQMIEDSRESLVGAGATDFIELRGTTKGVASWCTRGQYSWEDGSMKAMTGFQARYYTHEELKKLLEPLLTIKESEQTRDHTISFMQRSLRSSNKIYKEGGGVTLELCEKSFRVGYDNRRSISTLPTESVYTGLLDTKPYQTVSDATTVKQVSNMGKGQYAPKTGYKPKGTVKDYKELVVRMFTRAVTQGYVDSFSFKGYKGLKIFIYEVSGFNVTENYIAKQKSRKFIPRCIPQVSAAVDILQKFKDKIKDLDLSLFMQR